MGSLPSHRHPEDTMRWMGFDTSQSHQGWHRPQQGRGVASIFLSSFSNECLQTTPLSSNCCLFSLSFLFSFPPYLLSVFFYFPSSFFSKHSLSPVLLLACLLAPDVLNFTYFFSCSSTLCLIFLFHSFLFYFLLFSLQPVIPKT